MTVVSGGVVAISVRKKYVGSDYVAVLVDSYAFITLHIVPVLKIDTREIIIPRSMNPRS